MHVVTPRSFNDAQQVADEFKRSKPVIINLQSTDRELSKRLIDFSSGMTYALGGGMQRDRAGHLPAHARERRGLGRGKGAHPRGRLLQPVLAVVGSSQRRHGRVARDRGPSGLRIEFPAMKVGFVGAGNMAGGLARGWAAAEGEPGAPEAMLFADAEPERAQNARRGGGGRGDRGQSRPCRQLRSRRAGRQAERPRRGGAGPGPGGHPGALDPGGHLARDPPRGASRDRPGSSDAQPRARSCARPSSASSIPEGPSARQREGGRRSCSAWSAR